MRYKAWGEVRYQSGTLLSDRTYTGQRTYASDFGLMYYNARWYDNQIGHFAQADNIDVKVGSTQPLDRYAYVLNNPVLHNDPTGHCTGEGGEEVGGEAAQDCANELSGIAPELDAQLSHPWTNGTLVEGLNSGEVATEAGANGDYSAAAAFTSEGVDATVGESTPQTQNLQSQKTTLPIGDDALANQVDKVIDGMQGSDKLPPGGVAQGGALNSIGKWVKGLFLNFKNQLPAQPEGFYTESDVWPTFGGSRKPFPQRLVFGQDGSVYFSPDHYISFAQIK